MRSYYDAIYLSPHLDDVALSCGGQIFTQTTAGKRILIVTIMAGGPTTAGFSDYVQSLHQRWQLAGDVVAQRRAEDQAACHILGADFRHWDTPDCIYRRHPATGKALYRSDEEIFGPVQTAESALIDQLARQMQTLPAGRQRFVPLTVGHHVDHQITRAAAEQSFGIDNITYYEDYPYVREPEALGRIIPSAGERWRPHMIPLMPAAKEAKIEAIAAFKSQLSSFFTSHDDLKEQIDAYTNQVGGERFWHQVSLTYPAKRL